MPRTAARILAVALLAALAAVAVAVAHTPPDPGARFEVHDHSVKGRNWHVQFQVARSGDALRNFVIYAQECGETAFAQRVPLDSFSDFSVVGDTFAASGHFASSGRVEGVWRILKGSCDTGVRDFVATRVGAAHRHTHAGHRGHAMGTMPDLSTATARQRAATRRLWRATLRAADQRPFTSYTAARAAGFVRYPRKWDRPVVFHLRRGAYERDGRTLDPRRPESLVYWWPRKGRPVLVGFMFRARAPGRPPGGPLFAWHRHFENGHLGRTQMTHIWLTGTLRTALANCLPIEALEEYVPRFDYSKPRNGSSEESLPCKGSGG